MSRTLVLVVCLTLAPAIANAEKVKPTPLPTPQAQCYDMQHCVDAAVPPIVVACRQGFECNVANERFAITANQAAERAIQIYRCDSKTFTKKSTCNTCFKKAKSLIKDKMVFGIFRGLLSYTNWNILQAQRGKCDSIQ